MFNSPFIETIISLTLLFFFFSVLVSCVQEGTVRVFKSRAKMLSYAIDEVLNDKFNKNFAYLLYQHPQIDLLKEKQSALPSYIEGRTFAQALIDLIVEESTETVYILNQDKNELVQELKFKENIDLKYINTAFTKLVGTNTNPNDPETVSRYQKFRMGVDALNYSEFKRLLLSFISMEDLAQAKDPAEVLSDKIENWYNAYMDRVTGWYKRKVRVNIFYASFVVTLILNLNFITVAKTIYSSASLRASLVSVATAYSEQNGIIDSLHTKFSQAQKSLEELDINEMLGVQLPIGWNPVELGFTEGNWYTYSQWNYVIGYFFKKHFTPKNILGWLIFGLALTRGAPFWFDVMKRFVNVRNTGITPTSKSE